MLPKFFDAHTHANLEAFKDDYKEVVSHALSAGIGMVNVGTDKNTSLRAVEIAHEFENDPVFAAVGLHPTDADEGGFDYDYYKELALDPRVVAIGECGLDYFRIKNNELGIKGKQKWAFEEQIRLASDVQKPLMIHCRNAFGDLIEILTHNSKLLIPGRSGVIHFFSGTKDEAKKLADMGFYFTFGGVITFVRDYDEVIRFIPADRILSETDAPYVTPVPYRGKRNEPAYVIEVVKKLSKLKSIPVELMAEQVLKNISECFNLKLT